jgi:hypothetical protein
MNEKLPHILTTSANLLGVCFFIITGIHLANGEENQEIMRLVATISILLLLSCLLSYLSIRSDSKLKQALLFEHIADYLFLASITMLCIAVGLLAFDSGLF